MDIRYIVFAAVAASIIAAGNARAADPLVRSAAVCTTETGGVQFEICIDSTAGKSGIWQCSTETCEGAGWKRGDNNDTLAFSGALITKVAHTSKTSGASAIWAAVDTEEFDVGGWHASTNAFFTIPSGVAYVRVCAGAFINSSILGPRQMQVELEGLHVRGMPSFEYGGQQQDGNQAGFSGMSICGGVVAVSEGDEVQMRYEQTTGSTFNLAGTTGGFDSTFLSIQKVR